MFLEYVFSFKTHFRFGSSFTVACYGINVSLPLQDYHTILVKRGGKVLEETKEIPRKETFFSDGFHSSDTFLSREKLQQSSNEILLEFFCRSVPFISV